MSDSFLYTEMSEYISDGVSKQKSSDSKLTSIKIFVGILCVIIAIEIVVYTLIMPVQNPVNIHFSGLHMYTSEEMLQILNVPASQNWVKFNSATAASILSDCPWIESVSIEKQFPSKILINVTERTPVALTLINIDDRTVPVQIDENGVLFSAKAGTSVSNLPLISGIPIEYFVEGMSLPNKYRMLLQQLLDIQKNFKEYLAAISEIHIEPKEYGNYDLIIYPINSKVKVLADRTLNKDALQYMIVALDIVKSISVESEIDLRYGSRSFRINGSVD